MPTNRPDLAAILAQLAELLNAQPDPMPEPARPLPPRVLLTVEEAAEHLGVGRTFMVRLIGSGAIESVKIGRLRRVPVSAVDSYARRLMAEQSPKNAA